MSEERTNTEHQYKHYTPSRYQAKSPRLRKAPNELPSPVHVERPLRTRHPSGNVQIPLCGDRFSYITLLPLSECLTPARSRSASSFTVCDDRAAGGAGSAVV